MLIRRAWDAVRRRPYLFAGAACATIVLALATTYLVMGWMIYDALTAIEPGEGRWTGNTPARFEVRGGCGEGRFDTTPYLMPRYEELRIPSRLDRVGLAAWWVETSPGAPAVIVVHGIRDTKAQHLSLIPAGMLWHAGISVLLIDLREHGESDAPDGRTAAGNEEFLDVLGAWDWLVDVKGIPPPRVGVFGYSLGAATVLIAAGQEPRIAAAFVDSPYTNLPAVIAEELERNGHMRFLAAGGIIMGRLLGGIDLLAHSPDEELLKLGARPLFVTHGLADTRVLPHHTERLVAIASNRRLNVESWLVPGSDHVEAMLRHPEEYRARLVEFFRRSLR